MQVCLDYSEGLFLRINSKDHIRPCVAIPKEKNPFLDHDSHIDCSLQMIDEYEIDCAIQKGGIYGQVNLCHAPELLEELLKTTFISKKDKDYLKGIFRPYLPADAPSPTATHPPAPRYPE